MMVSRCGHWVAIVYVCFNDGEQVWPLGLRQDRDTRLKDGFDAGTQPTMHLAST